MVDEMNGEKLQDLLHSHPAADRMPENPFAQQFGVAPTHEALEFLATVIPTLANLVQLQGRARQQRTTAYGNLNPAI
jgi:hypothetical protein